MEEASIPHQELLKINEKFKEDSYKQSEKELPHTQGALLTKTKYLTFLTRAREIYNKKRESFRLETGRVLPDLMQDVNMYPANANARLKQHIQLAYQASRQIISGYEPILPPTLPERLGREILESATMARRMEIISGNNPGASAAANAGPGAAAANLAAAANPGLRRRRGQNSKENNKVRIPIIIKKVGPVVLVISKPPTKFPTI